MPQLRILSWAWQVHWDQHGAATIDSFEPSQKKKTKENLYSNICFYFFNLKLTKHQTSELALNLQFGTLNHYWDTFSSHGYWIKINHVWKQDFPYSCNRAHLWILYFSKRIFRFLAVMMDGICAIPFIQWNLGRCNLDYIGTCIWWKGSVYCQPPFRFNGSIQSLLILVLIFLWRNFEQKM